MRYLAVPLLVTALAACAGTMTYGEGSGLKWRVAELTTSERAVRQAGYKDDGLAKDYWYVVIITESQGVGINFREVESLLLTGPGFTPTPRTHPLIIRLAPHGTIRVTMTDSVWLVVPQWFEGTARRVNLDPISRKTFVGTNERGEPVKLMIEFRLESIPADPRRSAHLHAPRGIEARVPGLTVGLSR